MHLLIFKNKKSKYFNKTLEKLTGKILIQIWLGSYPNIAGLINPLNKLG